MMAHYFSSSTGSCYDNESGIYPLPSDAVEITAAQHVALIAAQNTGKVLQLNSAGVPVAVDRTATLAEVQTAQATTLRAACAAAIVAGFSSDVSGTSCTYPLSQTDQTNLARAYNLALLAESTATMWAASTVYAANAVVKSGGSYYLCTTAGTSGTAEPTWPTAFAVGVTEGTAVWKLAGYEIQTSSGYEWHTPAQVVALYLAEAAFVSGCLSKLQALLATVEAATTSNAVTAIVWS